MKFMLPILAALFILRTELAVAQNTFCQSAKVVIGKQGFELKTGVYKNAVVDRHSKSRSSLIYGIYERGVLTSIPAENANQNLWLNRCGIVASQDVGSVLPEGEYYAVSDRDKCYYSWDPLMIPHSWTAELRGLKNGTSAYIACYSSGAQINLQWINSNLLGIAEVQLQN